MVWTHSTCSCLKLWGRQLTKMERKKITNILLSFSAAQNIHSWRVKSALSNVVSLSLASSLLSSSYSIFLFFLSLLLSTSTFVLIIIVKKEREREREWKKKSLFFVFWSEGGRGEKVVGYKSPSSQWQLPPLNKETALERAWFCWFLGLGKELL